MEIKWVNIDFRNTVDWQQCCGVVAVFVDYKD